MNSYFTHDDKTLTKAGTKTNRLGQLNKKRRDEASRFFRLFLTLSWWTFGTECFYDGDFPFCTLFAHDLFSTIERKNV